MYKIIVRNENGTRVRYQSSDARNILLAILRITLMKDVSVEVIVESGFTRKEMIKVKWFVARLKHEYATNFFNVVIPYPMTKVDKFVADIAHVIDGYINADLSDKQLFETLNEAYQFVLSLPKQPVNYRAAPNMQQFGFYTVGEVDILQGVQTLLEYEWSE